MFDRIVVKHLESLDSTSLRHIRDIIDQMIEE